MKNGKKDVTLPVIARIRTDFPGKFGIPRQSGRVPTLRGEIVFEEPYRNPEALRDIEGYSHLWLIWLFSEVADRPWSPTVRPPRLGGNRRVGVFASRSPFRPSPVGLSSVKLEEVRKTADRGTVLIVSGADLMYGTPILDIKPYLPMTDSHPEASAGFAEAVREYALEVVFPAHLLAKIPEERRETLRAVLAEDPRPSYQDDPGRLYGFVFAGQEIEFTVEKGILTVWDVLPEGTKGADRID